jgi:hypothetical protein
MVRSGVGGATTPGARKSTAGLLRNFSLENGHRIDFKERYESKWKNLTLF